ncbi:hypothetical protein KF707_15680 [Candidatus Obscuribacterales bacterium]|nr:hypothetical protein [Candidatus Obscuribacterales bacterium]MBX3153363.1 hypothetical protein [Candidatus Obscuribacterales bacterium]
MLEGIFGDSCSDVRSGSGDPGATLRLMEDANRNIARHTDATPNQTKSDDFIDYSESMGRAAVRAYDSQNLYSAAMVLQGSESGRMQTDATGKPRGYDGLEDSLRLARQNGADGPRIEALEQCATMLGKSIFGKDYKLPHRR